MLGAMEFEGPEHRERLAVRHFEQRYEPSLRDNVGREIGRLCHDVVKATGLPEAKRKALEKKLEPVQEPALEAWRLALKIHFQTMPTVEDAESSAFLGDAFLHPKVVAADLKGMQLWDSILKAELGEALFDRWKQREKEMRADYAKANEAVVAKLIAQAGKERAARWQMQVKRVADTLGWAAEVSKPLMDLANATALTFEKGFAERMKEVSPRDDELLLGCSTEAVTDLRRRQTRAMYPPRMRGLQEETQRVMDEALAKGLSTEDKEKLAANEAKVQARINEAIKNSVKQQMDQLATSPILMAGARVSLLADVLQLPEATAELLAKEIAEGEGAAKESWCCTLEAHAATSTQAMLKTRDAEEIVSFIERGSWRWSSEEADQKLAHESRRLWQKTLETHLTAQQGEQWLRYEQQQRERKASALVKLTVSEVDLKVRLQAKQRETLETALRPVADRVAQIPGGLRAGLQWGSLDGSLMLLEGLEKGRLEELLTPQQMRQLEAMSSRYKAYWRAVQAKLELLKEDVP